MSGSAQRAPLLRRLQRHLANDTSTEQGAGFSARAVGSGVDPALQSAALPVPTLGELIATALTRCRDQTLLRIRRVNEMTSREVIAVGNSLAEIVDCAQRQVDAARRAMTELTGSDGNGMADLIDRQTTMTKNHVVSIREALAAQVEMTQRATQASSSIMEIGKQVFDVARAARMLSLNASIEGARLGQSGAGIAVIAVEMRSLTDEIKRANGRIESMAESLLSLLPQILVQTELMSRYAEEFAEDLSSNAGAVSAATERLRTVTAETLEAGDRNVSLILKGSQAALSHLQFQDPAAQGLLIVDADLAKLEGYVNEVVEAAHVANVRLPGQASFEQAAAEAHRELNAGEVVALDGTGASEAGEVLLF